MDDAMRVAIPEYTRAYAAGERTGSVSAQWHSYGVRAANGEPVTICRVLLDKSGKTRPFILEDCKVLDGLPAGD